MFSACGGTSYKVAPSTAKVQTKIATAKRTVQHARQQTTDLGAAAKDTQAKATTTSEHIDASLKAITAKDYVTAAQELASAKASNEVVMSMLVQSYRNVVSLGKSLEQTDADLVAAEQEVQAVSKEFEKVVIQGASDRAIVEEVNWGFLGVHIGALFYFFKSVLRLGFIGVVVLIVLGVALLILGATVGGPFLKAIGWLWGLLRPKKQG